MPPDEVAQVLFSEPSTRTKMLLSCSADPSDAERIRCLYGVRYKDDEKAKNLAYELYSKWRVIVGVEAAHTMNGGYRGMIRLEPALPIGAERKHLEWVGDALEDFDVFFTELKSARSEHVTGTSKPYRFRPLTIRFMRSVAARTPAAYAHDWTVAYNFAGSLNVSAEAVRETMFHEIFHLNDAAHGDWSSTALAGIFDSIVKRCGTAIKCLTPYSPNGTIVRGGTYYSFMPGNGVMEYAAELALRYYREQRAQLRHQPKGKPAFKCGPSENARAWALMREEFFYGVDLVPDCS